MAYMKLLREIGDWPEEKAAMATTINSLEEEKAKLQDDHELELEKAQGAHRELEQEIEKLNNQKNEQRESLERQEIQIAFRDKKIETLTHDLHFARESEEKLKTENKELKGELSSHKHKAAEAKIVMEAMRQETVSLKEHIASEKGRIEAAVREAEERTGSLFLYNLWLKRPDVDVSFFGPDAVAEVKLYAQQDKLKAGPSASSAGAASADIPSSESPSSPRPINIDDSDQKNFPVR